jgi:hypothetical protein
MILGRAQKTRILIGMWIVKTKLVRFLMEMRILLEISLEAILVTLEKKLAAFVQTL